MSPKDTFEIAIELTREDISRACEPNRKFYLDDTACALFMQTLRETLALADYPGGAGSAWTKLMDHVAEFAGEKPEDEYHIATAPIRKKSR